MHLKMSEYSLCGILVCKKRKNSSKNIPDGAVPDPLANAAILSWDA